MNGPSHTSRGPLRPGARRTVNSPVPAPAHADDAPTAEAQTASEETIESTEDLVATADVTDATDANALKVALNRPISLADVRAVQSHQSALASEATHVGPTNK